MCQKLKPWPRAVYVAPPSASEDYLRALLSAGGKDGKIVAVLKEDTRLLDSRTGQVASIEQGEAVRNVSTMTSWTQSTEGALQSRSYTHTCNGRVDLAQRHEDPEFVFNWDDVVVSDDTGMTLDNARQTLVGKISSRDYVIESCMGDLGLQ